MRDPWRGFGNEQFLLGSQSAALKGTSSLALFLYPPLVVINSTFWAKRKMLVLNREGNDSELNPWWFRRGSKDLVSKPVDSLPTSSKYLELFCSYRAGTLVGVVSTRQQR